MKKRLALSAIAALAAFAAAVTWWRSWMYHGMFGAPGIVEKIAHLDGEAAYNGMFLEMYIICLSLTSLAVLIVRNRRGR